MSQKSEVTPEINAMSGDLQSANKLFSRDIIKERKQRNQPIDIDNVKGMDERIKQHIESGNWKELERVNGGVTITMIDQIMEKLKIDSVLPFLAFLSSKLEENPRKGNLYLKWIKSLLCHNALYLESVPDIKEKLQFIHKLLDTRATTYQKLLKLNGRLDLVLAHANSENTDGVKNEMELEESNDEKEKDSEEKESEESAESEEQTSSEVESGESNDLEND